MADEQLQKLREAFASAQGGSATLNDAFWTDAGLTPPEGFTDAIKAAFRLGDDASGLQVSYDTANVGQIRDNSFKVTGVSLTFLNAERKQTSATIHGSDGDQRPILGIDVVLDDWSLQDQFEWMTGWPFTIFNLNEYRFFYTTANQTRSWNGGTLRLQAGQNLYGELTVPDAVRPLFKLITNLAGVSDSLVGSGPIVLDKADNETVLYPDMDFAAAITGEDLEFFFLEVARPRIGLKIQTVDDGDDENKTRTLQADEDGDEDGDEGPAQTPSFFFAVDLAVKGTDGHDVALTLEATVSPRLEDYQLGVTAADRDQPITPQAVIALMAGQSYFENTPAALQRFLAAVEMQGLTFSGPLRPEIKLTQVGILLGSTGGADNPMPLFTDPTNQQAFEIKSFSLDWMMLRTGSAVTSAQGPGLPAQPQANGGWENMVSFSTVFTLFPSVFKTKDGKKGGEFHLEIDQDLNIEGGFDGKASLEDVLNGISGGLIGLPEGVSADFSDMWLQLSPSQKTYSFGLTVDAAVDVPFIQGPKGDGDEDKPLIAVVGMKLQLTAITPSKSSGNSGEQALVATGAAAGAAAGVEGGGGKTVYRGSIDGEIIVGPATAAVKVDYDGTAEPPVWSLSTSLANQIDLSDLIDQLFQTYGLPEFLPGTLTVESFEIDATIPVSQSSASALAAPAVLPASPTWRSPVRALPRPGDSEVIRLPAQAGRVAPLTEPARQKRASYQVSGKLRWHFELTPKPDPLELDLVAELGLNYDGNRKANEQYAGWVIGEVEIDLIGAAVQIGYRFGPAEADAVDPGTADQVLRLPMTDDMRAAAASGDSAILWMAWKGVRAEYDFAKQTVTFSLSGWTLGGIITALMEMLDRPYFTLPAPWSLLNQISLDGFEVVFDLKSKSPKQTDAAGGGLLSRIKVTYSLPSPLELGFATINGLELKQVDGKVTLLLDASVHIGALRDDPLFNKDKDQGKGQDVEQMPDVPGRGSKLFELQLLAMGQRVGIWDSAQFESTQDVIEALQDIPPSDGTKMPFDPSNRTKGQPYYDQSRNWLIAMHFGVLKLAENESKKADYAFDFMVVFNDPDLYGLRLQFAGTKAKVLAGLAIDILYKKVTDDIGLYQVELTLPSALRHLNFGAVGIILPSIGIQIYTNGDFKFDIGFPYDLDFSVSFTVQAIIYGVPVLGSGGLYFGKLSNATAKNLPKTTKGSFDPVIVFGLGAQLGLGYEIDKGILKAGFSITVFGIIEGTIAAWHPYEASGEPSGGREVQGQYYFKLSGSFGLIGKLYGSVSFAVISADVSLVVKVVAKIVYESFRAIPLSLAASVDVKVAVKIDLGLFSITLHLSFHTRIAAELTIGQDQIQKAPWYDASQALARPTLADLALAEPPVALEFTHLHALAVAQTESIELTAATQLTVLAPEGAGYSDQEGACVLLFAMDAPRADAEGNGADTSFGKLCAALLPWLVQSIKPQAGAGALHPRLAESSPDTVSRMKLEALLKVLTDPAKTPFTVDQLTDFMGNQFEVAVTSGDQKLSTDRKAKLDQGATIFPAFGFLSLTVPNPDADDPDTVTIAFDAYATATSAYKKTVRQTFDRVAAQVGQESGTGTDARAAAGDDAESLAASVFVDYFVLLARQLVQAAIDGFDDFAYPLTKDSSIQSILSWAKDLGNDEITADDVIGGNLDYPLTAGVKLSLTGLTYTIQAGDTLQDIATRYTDPAEKDKRWHSDPADLIAWNGQQNNLIAPGRTVTLTIDGKQVLHPTQPGDSFAALAKRFGLDLANLADHDELYGQTGLLAASITTHVPPITYTTAAFDEPANADTLQAVFDRFHLTRAQFLTSYPDDTVHRGGQSRKVIDNRKVADLFLATADARFAIANLSVLEVAALWDLILRTEGLSHIAGMAGRFMLHGMRLPNADGLGLPKDFLYATPHWSGDQDAYGVYQLTGQQFPIRSNAGGNGDGGHGDATNGGAGYAITLARPSGNGSDPYPWLTLGDGTSLTVDIGTQVERLDKVVGWARSNGYQPGIPKLAPEPRTDVQPRRYGMAAHAGWTSSEMSRLLAVTAPPSARAAADQDGAPQPRPVLWSLSPSLVRSIEKRQAGLGRVSRTVDVQAPYLPKMKPIVGKSDPATSTTRFSDVTGYALATRVDFRIKRLAQTVDQAPPQPGANDIVPPGPGNSGATARQLAPYSYELLGPTPGEAKLLERLLTALDSLGEDAISGLFLLYQDPNNGSGALTSRSDDEYLAFIVQSNLSTETNPPRALAMQALAITEAPRGIANAPAEFVKLMWELSTVNSGGYFLFYQIVEGGGLPEALFDDSGVATLTMVVTYSRSADLPTEGRITNYTNALVTTDPIDPQDAIVELEGVSTTAESAALPEDATLADLAQLYGVGVGTLMRPNLDAPLVDGARIPIAGLSRQLKPGDVGPDKDPLQMLADHYSKGATQPVSKQDIQDWNPDTQADALAVFRIPTFTYQVSGTDGGPGNRFRSIMASYDMPVDALAYQAKDVAGLFAAGSTLKVDPTNLDAQQNLGVGNAGLSLERERGTAPDFDNQSLAAYAENYLLQQYQLLQADIAGNPYFGAGPVSPAFGPKEPAGDDSPTAQQARGPRPLAQRLGASDPSTPYRYDQALGYAGFAKTNAAPKPADAKLPQPDANPYAGIGTILQFGLSWLDLFGNRIPSPLSDPQAGDPGPYGRVPAELLYADALIALDQWPNVTRSYRYAGEPGAPNLTISLLLDATPYQPSSTPEHAHLDATNSAGDSGWLANAKADLKTYTKLYFQLVQNYGDVGLKGLDGFAVSMSLRNSLLDTPTIALDGARREQIVAFVEACIRFLQDRIAGTQAKAPASDLSIGIDLDQVASGRDIFRLDLELILTRQGLLSDPALRGVTGGLTATTTIPADGQRDGGQGANGGTDADGDGGGGGEGGGDAPSGGAAGADAPHHQLSLTGFAKAMEKVFQTDDWQLRVGTGAADPAQPANSRAVSLWAARMAKTDGPNPKGLGFDIGKQPVYYAPRPVASDLQTLQASIKPYATGQSYPAGDPTQATFTGVDPNLWLADCLSAIDDFLSASYATPTFILDRLLGLHEQQGPEGGDAERAEDGDLGYLTRMLQAKDELANAISGTLLPVLENSAPTAALDAAAKEKLKQALLRRLSEANSLTAVTVFPVDGADYAPELPAGVVSAPRFYGQPEGEISTPADTTADAPATLDNYALTSAKVPLTKDQAGKSTLAFLFNSRNADQSPYVPLKLNYAVSHLEHDIRDVPGIKNYRQAAWITFLTGPFDIPLAPASGDAFNFPVALRALPAPPTVSAQSGTPSDPTVGKTLPGDIASDPGRLKRWSYSFSYLLDRAAQDTVVATIELNRDTTAKARADALAGDPKQNLFEALAQFTAVYPAIARDLESFLRPLDASNKPDDGDVSNAKHAVDAMTQVVRGVAQAYKRWADPQAAFTQATGASLPRVVYTFETVLRRELSQGQPQTGPAGQAADADAVLDVLPQAFEINKQTEDYVLPLAKVWIDRNSYQPEIQSKDEKTGQVSYKYKRRTKAGDNGDDEPQYLSYPEALRINEREIGFAPLDLLALQNGWASVRIVRNQHLQPDPKVKTTDAFRFATTEARFANPMVPLLNYDSFQLDQPSSPKQPIADWLAQLFKALLTPDAGMPERESVLVSLEARYRYRLDGPNGPLPPVVLPIALLPPTSTDGKVEPAFVPVLAKRIVDWVQSEQPVADDTAAFSFGLKVFSASDRSDLPLLRVREIRLSADKVAIGD